VIAPVCVTSTAAGMPWLQGRHTETAYDDDPVSRATFGVYRSGPIIYMREIY
jgi:MSHA biogenesis protein MshQ